LPLKNKARTPILVSLFFLALHVATAQGQWYEIVHVDLQAQDAVAAKEEATAQAEKNATKRFFSRIAPDVLNSPEQLDEVSSKCYAGMDILSEKTSGVRYIAKIKQNFNRSCVLGFLKQNAIQLKNKPLDEVSPTAANVHPPLKTSQAPKSSQTLLFIAGVHPGEKSINPWSDNSELPPLVAQNLNNINGYIVPLGDLNDQIILPTIELDHMGYETFQKILRQYEATQAVLVLIRLKAQEDLNPLTAIESFKISPESFKRCPVKEVPGEGKISSVQLATFIAEAASQSIQSCNIEDMLQNIGHAPAPIQVSVGVSDYTSWLKIKKDLESINEISKITINEMASSYVELDVHLNGNFENFQRNLQYLGLLIKEISGQNKYELRSGATTE
jgi:hypothetical protein